LVCDGPNKHSGAPDEMNYSLSASSKWLNVGVGLFIV